MADDRVRRATSADVARAAGVSRATVSYVLNDTPGQKIPAETRRRVLEAAARLEYAPSAAARALRSGRSDVVLCLLPDWPIGQQMGVLLSALSGALARYGITFVAHPAARAERPISQLWKSMTPAAVVAFEDFSDSEMAAMRAAGVAYVEVLLGRSRQRPGELEVPQQRVGQLQAEHLAAAGHLRVGYAYPDDSRLYNFADPRLAGVRTACARLGLAPPAVAVVPLESEGAAAAVGRWHGADEAVTGVCAYNDEVALAVLAGARLSGLAVPGDLAVIGVDDIPAARLCAPALTTVTTDQVLIAEHLTEAVLGLLAGRVDPPRLDGELVHVVHRESG